MEATQRHALLVTTALVAFDAMIAKVLLWLVQILLWPLMKALTASKMATVTCTRFVLETAFPPQALLRLSKSV